MAVVIGDNAQVLNVLGLQKDFIMVRRGDKRFDALLTARLEARSDAFRPGKECIAKWGYKKPQGPNPASGSRAGKQTN